MSKKSRPTLPQDPKRSDRPQDNRSDLLRTYAAWTGLAFQMAAFVVAGLLIAKLISKTFDLESPWIILAGILAGVIAALVFAIRFILKHQNDS